MYDNDVYKYEIDFIYKEGVGLNLKEVFWLKDFVIYFCLFLFFIFCLEI